jgi:GTP pyrophosphokinase
VYGDEVKGFVSKGQGIKVHRADCPNIAKERRLIDIEWDPNKPDIRYEASVKIFSKDRSYLLTDLVTVVAQYKANLTAVNSQANNEDLTATTSLSFMVNDLEHLENIMANLRKVESVISVERAIK